MDCYFTISPLRLRQTARNCSSLALSQWQGSSALPNPHGSAQRLHEHTGILDHSLPKILPAQMRRSRRLAALRFIKSILAGVLAFTMVSGVYMVVMHSIIPHCSSPGCDIRIDWWAVLTAPSYLLMAFVAFVLGLSLALRSKVAHSPSIHSGRQ